MLVVCLLSCFEFVFLMVLMSCGSMFHSVMNVFKTDLLLNVALEGDKVVWISGGVYFCVSTLSRFSGYPQDDRFRPLSDGI